MASDFESIVSRFAGNMDSLREYTNVLSPVARQTEVESLVSFLEVMKAPDSSDEARDANKGIQQVIDSLRQGAPTAEALQPDEQVEEEMPVTPDGEPSIQIPISWKALRAVRAFGKRTQTMSILNRSALMTVISFFELLLADVFRSYYRSYPQALSGNDKIFSVNDLKVFDTVQEVLEHLANERVDNLLRQSLSDWVEFFGRLKLDITAPLKPQWDEIEEIYQRRNILVHNDGIVNKIYLSKVPEKYMRSLKKPRKLGDKLGVSTTYLHNALDLFTVLGVTLVDQCWCKYYPSETKARDRSLTLYIYEHELAGNWAVVEALARHGLSRDCVDLEQELLHQMNFWLAVKRLGRWSEIEPVVRKFDTKACHPKFALAVYSLLDDIDACFKILPVVAATGDVPAANICEWPILQEMRDDKRFGSKLKDCYPDFNYPSESSESA